MRYSVSWHRSEDSAMRRSLLLVGLALASALGTVGLCADDVDEERLEYIRANYTKFEHRIPMRDGVHLFTAVYVPNDRSKRYPMLMFRTPYGIHPYGADRYADGLGPHSRYEREGFIFVLQDVRGRYMSEGSFVNMRPHVDRKSDKTQTDESTDTYDTIEWLLANVGHHNGRVGQWGISYPGFYTSAGVIDSHPALKAVSPQAPIADWFWDDMHHHGAFILHMAFNFFSSFGQPRPEPTTERVERFDHGTPDAYQFFLEMGPLKNANEKYLNDDVEFWNEVSRHPNYDQFWQSRNILPHLKNITAAVMVVGGWYDTEDLYGPLQTYRSIETNNPAIFNVLVMGPWSHGGWRSSDGERLGDAEFGFKTSEYYRTNVEFPFFNHFLKEGEEPDLPEALVFETGANRWREFDAWPPERSQEKSLYLRADGSLSFEPPRTEDDASDAYISDPSKPVPYTTEISAGWTENHMTEDQRFAARRPDVLVYRTEVLESDLTLAGPIRADLWVSTTGSASDWVVKLIDVYPGEIPGHDPDSGDPDRGGQQTLVRAEVFRGRFRESYENPKPFVPGEVTRVSIDLQDILHTFKSGHRVMVQIQSSWFPFVDRNPQSYVPNIFEADEDDFITVTNRVHRSKRHPSRIEIGVLE
jgi:putative CocE/NonD family hydrolase